MEMKNDDRKFAIFLSAIQGCSVPIMQVITEGIKKEVGDISFISYIGIALTVIIVIAIQVFLIRKVKKTASIEIKEYKDEIESYKAELENTQNEVLTVQENNAGLNYIVNKYKELEDFYKKTASIIKLDENVSDTMLTQYLSKIEEIIVDNASIKGGNANVSIFVKTEGKRSGYKITLSNHHTKGTINDLILPKSSFVGKVFKDKRSYYISDIDNRKPDDKFCIRNGSKYKSIFGIPYIVDDVVVAAIIMTMDEASALDPVVGVREMNDLLERYVHIIGILMVMKSGKEGL